MGQGEAGRVMKTSTRNLDFLLEGAVMFLMMDYRLGKDRIYVHTGSPWVPCGRQASRECLGAEETCKALSIPVAGARTGLDTQASVIWRNFILTPLLPFSWVLGVSL